ncbi:MAG TPA: hypothetical protein VII69_12970 [Candidatus Eremiobacteraceae bacterium]
MQRVRILTADASSLGSQLESALDVHAPDVVALTGIGPARASRLAGPRSMRAATQAWSADDSAGLALLWKGTLAVGSMERFDFGQVREPCGALRITFPIEGRYVIVFCALLSSGRADAAAQKARLVALIDSAHQPTLVACDGAIASADDRWSRCADAWAVAQRRIISLAASTDVGFAARRAFGIAGGSTAADHRSHAGPVWHCSEEFAVVEARSISVDAAPDRPIRTVTVELRAGAAKIDAAAGQ